MQARTALIASVLAFFFAAGCRTTSGKPRAIDFTVDDTSSIVVIGVSPPMRLRAYQGFRSDEEWEPNRYAEPQINELPREGYAIVRMPPSIAGESYGILRVIPGVMNPLSVCTGMSAAVFDVPKNGVVYVGDLTLVTGARNEVEVRFDYDRALAFLRKTYPEFEGKLERSRAAVVKVKSGQCDAGLVTFVKQ
jgi:hypothetical protein